MQRNIREDFLVFGQPLIEQDEIDEVVDSLKKAWLGTGPKVRKFERIFSEYKGGPYAAAVNSCTAALHLSLLSLGLKPGDEVITTSMTFCATVNAIIHAGATPVLVDIDPVTLNIEPNAIEQKITDRTKAVVIVHFAGRCCRMDSILEITKRNKLFLVEDCAHAIESEYDGQKAGTFGDLSCFSFYSTKNIVTGEGGMVLSNHRELIEKIKILALHGMNADAWTRFSDAGYKHYYVEDAGYKYNMMDLQAAIGIHQMKRVDAYWMRRQEVWQRYAEAFSDLAIGLPAPIEKKHRHAHHLFTIRIDENRAGLSRDAFLVAMKQENIGTGVHYLAIPEHPYYNRTFGWKPDEFPNATEYGRQTVSLPISAKLSDKDVCDVIEAVKKIINKG